MGHDGVCILNVASGNWYPMGQKRLLWSVMQQGYKGGARVWTNEVPPGCPLDRPYAFKAFAIRNALADGHARVWWLDSSMVAIRPPTHALEWLDEHGIFIAAYEQPSEHTLGLWTSDAALRTFGIGREEAMQIPMVEAGNFALDLSRPAIRAFFDELLACATHPDILPGCWSTTQGHVADDPRVRGHRHDQSLMAWLMHKHGLPFYRWQSRITRWSRSAPLTPTTLFEIYRDPKEEGAWDPEAILRKAQQSHDPAISGAA